MDELGCERGDDRRLDQSTGGLLRHLHLVKIVESRVHCLVVHLDDLLAGFSVALLDGILDLGNGLFERDDVGDLEERRLHDHVDAGTEADFVAEADTVDDVKFQLFVDDLLLHVLRKLVPYLIRIEWCIEEERGALLRLGEHVILFDKDEVMAGDKVGFLHQVRRSDVFLAETEMGRGHGTRLLRIVHEICLGIVLGHLTDNFY